MGEERTMTIADLVEYIRHHSAPYAEPVRLNPDERRIICEALEAVLATPERAERERDFRGDRANDHSSMLERAERYQVAWALSQKMMRWSWPHLTPEIAKQVAEEYVCCGQEKSAERRAMSFNEWAWLRSRYLAFNFDLAVPGPQEVDGRQSHDVRTL